MPDYVELHCHSAFSFLDGASHPQELAAAALEHGHTALALTDHDGLYGALEHALDGPTVDAFGYPRGARGDRGGSRDPQAARRGSHRLPSGYGASTARRSGNREAGSTSSTRMMASPPAA